MIKPHLSFMTFTIPDAWHGQRILQHFGAVDWQATVFLNGRELGGHRGGYDAFTLDLTPALQPAAPNELVVSVWDPNDQHGTAQVAVGSYFVMRLAGNQPDPKGFTRFLLNGKSPLLFGTLDQGCWPDGIYTCFEEHGSA